MYNDLQNISRNGGFGLLMIKAILGRIIRPALI
jgi:hypothetical protein